jgi:hypothetical protein
VLPAISSGFLVAADTRVVLTRREALYDFKFVCVRPVLGSIGAEICV